MNIHVRGWGSSSPAIKNRQRDGQFETPPIGGIDGARGGPSIGLAKPCRPPKAPRSRRAKALAEEINRLFAIREAAELVAGQAEGAAHQLIGALDDLMGDVDLEDDDVDAEDDDCDGEPSIGFDENEQDPGEQDDVDLGACEEIDQEAAWAEPQAWNAGAGDGGIGDQDGLDEATEQAAVQAAFLAERSATHPAEEARALLVAHGHGRRLPWASGEGYLTIIGSRVY